MPIEPNTEGLTVERVPVDWQPELSIFASEPFLGAVSDEYGWLGGINGADKLRCILPYTIIHKAGIRLIRFRVETVPIDEELSLQEEKQFLNSSMEFFRSIRGDVIIPASTNAIFRAYPDGAIAAPYGSHIVDLTQPEETIWHNMSRGYRKDIRDAQKKGVRIISGTCHVGKVYEIIRNTFKRSDLSFMSYRAFERLVIDVGQHIKIFAAEQNGNIQSCAAIPFSRYCAYGLYGGSIANSIRGSFKLLNWEAMKIFRDLGVRRFDFAGSRIDPKKGSKQEGIMLFKQYFGGKLTQGYIWKYPLSKLKYSVYQLAVRLMRGGDIVDNERHKLVV